MGKTQPGKTKATSRGRRAPGRPTAKDPKVVTTSLRFSGELMQELDAWAKNNGDIGRSAAIRQAVARLVRGAQ